MNRRWLAVLPIMLSATVAACASLHQHDGLSPSSTASPSPVKAPSKPPSDPLAKLERSLLFHPRPYHPDDNWQPAGLPLENVRFQSGDGTKLHGWYVPHPRPRGVVLFCHGNAGNITHRVGMLQTLHERVGVSVMIFDYRGYGWSGGTPTEAGVLTDARAARAWLANRAGVAEDRIVLMGRSLGGAVAVDLAAGDGARALVLQSTFTSVPDVAAALYPLLPARLLMRTRFDSAAKIGRYRGPLLQSHGDADRIIPYRLGRRLHDMANQPKQFITIRGGDHNDPQTAEYYEALVAFLDGLP